LVPLDDESAQAQPANNPAIEYDRFRRNKGDLDVDEESIILPDVSAEMYMQIAVRVQEIMCLNNDGAT